MNNINSLEATKKEIDMIFSGYVWYDDHRDKIVNMLQSLLTTHEQQARIEGEKDKNRLDFLDKCNQMLNAHYKTDYGWKLVLSHNVTRLMVEHRLNDIDLNDAEGGNGKLKSCRDAIDTAINKFLEENPSA